MCVYVCGCVWVCVGVCGCVCMCVGVCHEDNHTCCSLHGTGELDRCIFSVFCHYNCRILRHRRPVGCCQSSVVKRFHSNSVCQNKTGQQLGNGNNHGNEIPNGMVGGGCGVTHTRTALHVFSVSKLSPAYHDPPRSVHNLTSPWSKILSYRHKRYANRVQGTQTTQ